MNTLGSALIASKRLEILASASAGKHLVRHEIDATRNRDILTLLLKANMATGIPDKQKLSDSDALAQIPAILIGGHESTSNAMAWCLYALSLQPSIQQEICDEAWSVHTENPSMDELVALPHLDSVIRETLRLYPSFPLTIRTAVKDDVIPLKEPFVDIHGQIHDAIKIRKDTPIDIPILALNRLKSIWGEDAFEFKPKRWASVLEAAQSIPGVWSNMMTFIGGPRACIGYRFALVQMKVLLFTLIRSFEFELAVSADEIIGRATVMRRPLVRSEREKGPQLPLLVKPYRNIGA